MERRRAPSPRFRDDDEAVPIRLQPDDLEILWHVYCNRVIDSKSIQILFPNRSPQVISRRLNLLRKGAEPYLRRLPQAQNRLFARSGSDPFAYALAHRGAEALRALRGVDIPPQRWTQKNRELRPSMIDHSLATSRFLAQMRTALAVEGSGRQLYYQEELDWLPKRHSPSAGLKNTIRTQIVDWYGYSGEEGTAPDAIFAIGRTNADGQRQFAYFFLEVDRGTETIVPGEKRLRSQSFWRSSSVLRKYVVYASIHKNRAHESCLGIPSFRVLTSVPNLERMHTIQVTCRQYLPNVKPGQFLFCGGHQSLWPVVKGNSFSDISGKWVEI